MQTKVKKDIEAKVETEVQKRVQDVSTRQQRYLQYEVDRQVKLQMDK